MSGDVLLEVEDLSVEFDGPAGVIRRVDNVSFTVRRGEVVGVVGESGSGKTLTSLAIARLLPRTALLRARALRFCGHDLLDEPEQRLRSLLGTEMAMIFQDPLSSLNPARRIGVQMCEAVREHRDAAAREARQMALRSLADVHISDPELRLRQYSFELSGGMRQRTMIAMGLMSRPSLVIADEPTTALDVTVQAQVMDLICDLNDVHGSSVLLVSHNIALLSEICDRLLVMYRGRLVEDLTVDELLAGPSHPYTRALVAAVPDLRTDRAADLATVPRSVDDAEITDA